MTSPRVVDVSSAIVTRVLDRPFVAGSVTVDATYDVFAVVGCTDGSVGIGYSTGFSKSSASALESVVDQVAVHLVGRAVEEWQLPPDPRVRGDDVGVGALAAHATGVWSMALLDAHGIVSERTAAAVIGSRETEMRCYLSGGPLDATEQELAALVELADELAVDVLKVKVDGREAITARQRVEYVLGMLPTGVDLAVDANQTFDRAGALAWVQELPTERIAWFEEPVPAADLAAIRAVSAGSAVPIAAGETTFGTAVVDWIIDDQVTDAVILNPVRLGGPQQLVERGDRALAASVTVHGHVFPQVTTQLMGGRWQGSLVEYLPWWDRLFEPGAYSYGDGRIRATGTVPGFGFDEGLRTRLTGG